MKNRIGEQNVNRFGTPMTIVEFNSNDDIFVQFEDAMRAVVHTSYQSFKKRQVRNPYDKSVFGIGCIGKGEYKTCENGVNTTSYLVWLNMLTRCYCEKWRHRYPTYYGKCFVCDEWLNYQNFAKWYSSNCYEVSERLHIDKDILCPGNAEYSPRTCILVPQSINMLFMKKRRKTDTDLPTGIKRLNTRNRVKYISTYNTKTLGTFDTVEDAYRAYVAAKQKHIQEVADSYQAVLPSSAYEALIEYKCPKLSDILASSENENILTKDTFDKDV